MGWRAKWRKSFHGNIVEPLLSEDQREKSFYQKAVLEEFCKELRSVVSQIKRFIPLYPRLHWDVLPIMVSDIKYSGIAKSDLIWHLKCVGYRLNCQSLLRLETNSTAKLVFTVEFKDKLQFCLAWPNYSAANSKRLFETIVLEDPDSINKLIKLACLAINDELRSCKAQGLL